MVNATPLIIAGALVAHHRYIHRDDPRLSETDKIFQINDIRNHETWVIFFIGVEIGLLLSSS